MSQCTESDLFPLAFLDRAQHLFLPQMIYLWFPTVYIVVKLPRLFFLRSIWNIYNLLEQEVISYRFSTGLSLRLPQAPSEPTRSPPNQALLPLPSHSFPSLPRALETTREKTIRVMRSHHVSEDHESTDCASPIPTSILNDPRVYF